MLGIQGRDGRVLPAAELVEAAGDGALTQGVTIDFTAEAELGHPLVVLRPPRAAGPPALFDALSPREKEIAACLAEGLRNKEIAGRLYISVATVKDHVHAVLSKTGLDSRAAVAAAWAGKGIGGSGRGARGDQGKS